MLPFQTSGQVSSLRDVITVECWLHTRARKTPMEEQADGRAVSPLSVIHNVDDSRRGLGRMGFSAS